MFHGFICNFFKYIFIIKFFSVNYIFISILMTFIQRYVFQFLACDLGSYGLNCSRKCNDNCGGLDKDCDHIKATCKTGCDQGYHGHKCLNNCSKTCARKDKACERLSGKCLEGCKPGYYGDKCLTTAAKIALKQTMCVTVRLEHVKQAVNQGTQEPSVIKVCKD